MRSFSYANSGQVSQDVRGASTTYGSTYNNNGRLSSASLNSSTVGSYVYNGLEQRVAKTVSSTTTHYVIDGDGRVMSENDASGNPIREYIWLNSMPVDVAPRFYPVATGIWRLFELARLQRRLPYLAHHHDVITTLSLISHTHFF